MSRNPDRPYADRDFLLHDRSHCLAVHHDQWSMALYSLPTKVILSHSCSTLGHWHLDWNPQPGACLEVDGQTYLILERRHRYLLQAGRYQLHKIALYVQRFDAVAEGSFVEGRWVLGDSTCRYNAHSELLRCAVNPAGSCDRCTHYQPVESLL